MSDVAYQNKDIVSKILTDGMKEKSFAVYGVPTVSYTHLDVYKRQPLSRMIT